MSKVLENICNKYELYKGQLIFTPSWKVEQLVGIGTDGEDYYYITYNGRMIVWNSCVGNYIPVKQRFEEEEYNELIRIAKLNYITYFDKIKKDDEEWVKYIKSLTKVGENEFVIKGYFWDLN